MSKFKEALERMKAPPPERLAKIEYQSHFLNIIGVLFASIFLIYFGYWYIIFAFIFSVGVSYSQGMAAYQKYRGLKMYTLDTNEIDEIENEISPTRKRTKIIQSVMGSKIGWVAALISCGLALWIINPIESRWFQNLAILPLIIFFYIIIFFFIFYWISNPIFKKRVERRYENGKTKENSS